MAGYHNHDGANVHHNPLDFLTWPILITAPAVWPVTPFGVWLWEHVPGPTGVYMMISAAFMLFTMSDKMGWLHRYKKQVGEPPELPPGD